MIHVWQDSSAERQVHMYVWRLAIGLYCATERYAMLRVLRVCVSLTSLYACMYVRMHVKARNGTERTYLRVREIIAQIEIDYRGRVGG